MIGPALKYPGAKWRISDWILAHMPRHKVYVEPFFGSGAVFFRKAPTKVEIVNDLDGRVVNFFRVCRERPEDLIAAVELTPWSREELSRSLESSGDELEDARRFLVRCWQSFGAKVGRKSGWRLALNDMRGAPTVSDWNRLPPRIAAHALRLKEAQIECVPAERLIPRVRAEDTLIYADPPYLMDSTPAYYRHVLSAEEHEELLRLLEAHTGPVLLSNYANALYDEVLVGWERLSMACRAESGKEREEVLWINPVAARALDGRLF